MFSFRCVEPHRGLIAGARESVYLVTWAETIREVLAELEAAADRGVRSVVSCGGIDLTVGSHCRRAFEGDIINLKDYAKELDMAITVDGSKQFATRNGADLAGVAPVERFDSTPPGHHPEDILPGARTVVVCARRIPAGTLDGPPTAYQRTMDTIHTNSMGRDAGRLLYQIFVAYGEKPQIARRNNSKQYRGS